MSFASNIKKQLCKINTECQWCSGAELAGILEFAGSLKKNYLKITTENENVAQRIICDISENFGFDIDYNRGEKNKAFQFKIEDKNIIENIQGRLYLFAEYDKTIANELIPFDCCLGSYVRGCFFGGGSISDPQKGYHLEFDTKSPLSAKHLQYVLKRLGYEAKTTYRKGYYIVYVKECEAIADILGCMGSGYGAMELYNVQIEKEMRNTVNRQVNCETANVDKVVKASVRHVDAINRIQSHIGLESLPEPLYEVARLRVEYPDESLKELSNRLGIGKSGVNHRLNRLMDIAKDLY